MEIDVRVAISPVPPPVLPDLSDSFSPTSLIPTPSVACFNNSATGMEFAALLKDVDKLEALRNAYAAEKKTFDLSGNSTLKASPNL